MESNVKISIEHQSTFSLAAQQNAFPIIKKITISNYVNVHEDAEVAGGSYKDLLVELKWDSELVAGESWMIDELMPNQSITLQNRDIKVSRKGLLELTDPIVVGATIEVLSATDRISKKEFKIDVLQANFWGGENRQPDLLAAFVRPNGPYVEDLVRSTTLILEKSGLGRSADGYQSNTREKPYQMAAALWSVIQSQKLSYVEPSKGFAKQGQRIRLAADISAHKNSACLDTSLLFASCFELMGLNSVVALTQGHAFVGVWLINQRFPVLTNDDAMDLRKRVDSKDLILIETTLVTNPTRVSFSEACAYARELISEDSEDDFVYVIDIAHARARQIRPLSLLEKIVDETKADEPGSVDLPPAPYLPPVEQDKKIEKETPQTRLDMWQRRLLDLTKKNPLLNHSKRALAVRLYCPDIGRMEDLLADGSEFRFESSANSPLNDKDRDQETFRLRTGNNLHKNYALEQLNSKILIANQTETQIERNLIELLRKSKTDLEEGGASTLFLSLGFLLWKETPESDREYKAPLVLIPVELVRPSARAAVRLRQKQEEPPMFNLTLIEFLKTQYDIDLEQFKEELPLDQSGIDLPLIWETVRRKISEQPGFELVEDLVLGSFSFAKYLMWKDIRDRISDLKENIFVSHLVDRPHEAYQQDSKFLLEDQVDEKIDYSEVFAPLNCDSSQLVAIEASGHPQDFVLEGPPGTGKSETIANIIAHNIAKGRKVLFVAEKMAALSVVYRRLQKIGLEHLCLELHSNKASKKSVLEQLQNAATKRESKSQEKWIKDVADLEVLRIHLNTYVKELHKKSIYGISLRDAIAREALYKDKHTIDLTWSSDFELAPIRSEVELDEMLKTTERAALTYREVQGLEVAAFSPIKSNNWSISWQENLIFSLTDYIETSEELVAAIQHLAAASDVHMQPVYLKSIDKISSLADLVLLSSTRPIGYAIGDGFKESLLKLKNLSNHKKALEKELAAIAPNITVDSILLAPASEWKAELDLYGAHWLKGWFVKRKINKSLVALGISPITDFNVIEQLLRVKQIVKEIDLLSEKYQSDGIWQGYETPVSQLEEAISVAEVAQGHLESLLSLSDDPAKTYKLILERLVVGRDLLSMSPLFRFANEFSDVRRRHSSSVARLSELGVEYIEEWSLGNTIHATKSILDSKEKLKLWCEWRSASYALSKYRIENFIGALEGGAINVDELEGAVLTGFCRWITKILLDESDVLREFSSISHEKIIQDFRELDANVANTTSEYIRSLSAAITPDLDSKDCPKEFTVLSREFQKRSKHKAVRVLLQELGGSILNLCPCMMMSPLSVAQFLPSDFRGFDLVVFDEASQITTWDSVGAIARGRNVIIVGDPKQMPPTNFFGSSVDVDDPDEEDLESILDQALAARLPHRRLKGHYRSRHETLIAFSNSKYYENSLVTYPSSETKESAVSLRKVNGLYAKGKGRNNPIEAKAVVDEVVRRLTDHKLSKNTIGIVTLNTEQKRTIEDFLDEARRSNPSIESFFHATDSYDPVFVKNLESVQGDERNLIILSLGYGPTEPNAKTMSMNFGPLNKAGGERRLNVAITRATDEVIVFTSFDSSMVDLSRTSSAAVEHLKSYLEFAERGPVVLSQQATASYGIDQFDSDFEQAVANDLRELGWKIQTQVGVSKFRIDLGVRHPDHPGLFLAGVECDGATYHGSPSARDRDRVRHGILENLGWRLVRLWSTDYFVDPRGSIDKVNARLFEILESDRRNAEAEKADETPLIESPSSSVSSTDDDSTINDDSDPSEDSGAISSTSIEYQGLILNKDSYFEPEYRKILSDLARLILSERNGIKLHTLALEMANLHGLMRTSSKQLDAVLKSITSWAGMKNFPDGELVIWLSQDDVTDEISWRGVDAFGYDRDWSEIPYPEQTGLARYVLRESVTDPVNMICELFALKRRHATTLEKFSEWLARVND
jgi:very-short-patch-repair endonuclease